MRQKTVGTFFELGGAHAMECLSRTGLDYVIIDTEHGMFSEESVAEYIRAAENAGLLPYVRIGDVRRPSVLRMLDIGARGLIVPNITDIAQVKEQERYAKFPPLGQRGYCPNRTCGWGADEWARDVISYIEECTSWSRVCFSSSSPASSPGAASWRRPSPCGRAGAAKEGLALRQRDGGIVVGRKIGITSRGMMKLLNVDTPDYGYLLNTGLVPEGTPCRRAELNVPILEGEIAFILGEDVTQPGVTVADIMNATAYVAPCFEVCDARYKDWKVTVRDTISDDAGASRYMLGSAPKRLSEINPRTIGMFIEKNGELLGTATGAEVMGSQLNSMMWLANKLLELGDGLKKGDIVLSGALMAAVPCAAGDSFTMTLDGFPPLTMRFI